MIHYSNKPIENVQILGKFLKWSIKNLISAKNNISCYYIPAVQYKWRWNTEKRLFCTKRFQ